MGIISSTLKEIKADIKNWWVFLLLGINFLIMGVIVYSSPVGSYFTLSVFFAVSVLFAGFLQIWFAFTNKNSLHGWGWQLTLGIIEVLIGISLLNSIILTESVLSYYVGFWLLFRSTALISFSIELASYNKANWGVYLILGILMLIFSWLIIVNPIFGELTIITWTGIAFIVAGIAYIVFSFRLKHLNKELKN